MTILIPTSSKFCGLPPLRGRTEMRGGVHTHTHTQATMTCLSALCQAEGNPEKAVSPGG